jgi:ATP/maltotriose-dependent transcriptional regulator MalT
VKTHLANLFAKLKVARRTQAIGKARDLQLIP